MLNLLNEANGSKFVTRSWKIVDVNSKVNYHAANEITYDTEILKSVLIKEILTFYFSKRWSYCNSSSTSKSSI